MTDWRDSAACVDSDPGLWHIPGDGSRWNDPNHDEQRAEAAAICSGCPVAAECLADALDAGDQHAYRAGTTPAQRDRIRRNTKRRKPGGRPVDHCPAGHDTTQPGARYADRSCKQCRRERQAARKKRTAAA